MEIKILDRGDRGLWDVELWDSKELEGITILTTTSLAAAKAIALALEPFVNDILP